MKQKKIKAEKYFFLVFIVFVLLIFYVTKFPSIDFIRKNQKIEEDLSGERWDQYKDLALPSEDNQLFNAIKDEKKILFHKNFLTKVQKCLSLNLIYEEEMQLVFNLTQGASREAVLRGLLSKLEVSELIDLGQTPLLSKEIIQWSQSLNQRYLQRDDFELPLDMRLYELKVLLMDEFLTVGEKHLDIDKRRFYLWAGYLLRDLLAIVPRDLSNMKLLEHMSKIPEDHLVTEVPLAICENLDKISAVK